MSMQRRGHGGVPNGQHYLAAGAVDSDVVARPSYAVGPLRHEDVGTADAGQHAHRLIVGFHRRAARGVEAAWQLVNHHHDSDKRHKALFQACLARLFGPSFAERRGQTLRRSLHTLRPHLKEWTACMSAKLSTDDTWPACMA